MIINRKISNICLVTHFTGEVRVSSFLDFLVPESFLLHFPCNKVLAGWHDHPLKTTVAAVADETRGIALWFSSSTWKVWNLPCGFEQQWNYKLRPNSAVEEKGPWSKQPRIDARCQKRIGWLLIALSGLQEVLFLLEKITDTVAEICWWKHWEFKRVVGSVLQGRDSRHCDASRKVPKFGITIPYILVSSRNMKDRVFKSGWSAMLPITSLGSSLVSRDTLCSRLQSWGFRRLADLFFYSFLGNNSNG